MSNIDDRNGQSISQNFGDSVKLSDKQMAQALREALKSEDTTYESLLAQRRRILKATREHTNLVRREEEITQLIEQLVEERKKTSNLEQSADLTERINQEYERQKVIKEEAAKRQRLIDDLNFSVRNTTEMVNTDLKNAFEDWGILLDETDLKKILDTEEMRSRVQNHLEALELQRKSFYADLDETTQLLEQAKQIGDDENIKKYSDSLSSIRHKLNETSFEINKVKNDLDTLDGKSGNRASNRVEQMFGKQFGSSLNYLGSKSGVIGSLLDLLEGGETGSNLFTAVQDASRLAEEQGETHDQIDDLLGAVEVLQPEFAPIVEALKVTNTVLNAISGIVTAINKQMGQFIDTAASQIASYYGTINAGLYGYSDYATMAGEADVLGGSTLVKQTDYLSQIASLSASGVARDIEAAAILQTIKDKTLTSFDASNDSLRRLIRLGNEQIYQSQFGLELQLKKVLNATFKDSGYLNDLFDSVTSAIMDASVSQTGDITSFNSVVQTWLGAMYSSGLSSNVVNQIAGGINSLGSGNVSALASDESTQRLFLLAMDRVGLDYADILQQGLSLSDTNQLMQSIIEYLGEISDNTSDNLVLKSSYANLFNLSMTDMQAIQTLNQNMPTIASMAVDTSQALSITQNAASSLLEANTSVSEKWDNFFENFQYSLGSNVAESSSLYGTWRVSSLISNAANSITSNSTLSKIPVVGAAAKVAQLASGAVQGAIGVISLIDALGDVSNSVSGGQGSAVASLLGLDGSSAATTAATNIYSRTSLKNSSTFKTMSASVDTAAQQVAEYKEDTDTGKILEEMEKTLMKTSEEGHYAFAVSLEGMNNNVLRSFASIFADEDEMLKTFTGNNSVLEKNMISYLDDTSNTSKA